MKKIIRHMADAVGPYLFQGLENVKNAISELSTISESKAPENSLKNRECFCERHHKQCHDYQIEKMREAHRRIRMELKMKKAFKKAKQDSNQKNLSLERGEQANSDSESENLNELSLRVRILHDEKQELQRKVASFMADLNEIMEVKRILGLHPGENLEEKISDLVHDNRNLSQENRELRAGILNLQIDMGDLRTEIATLYSLNTDLNRQNENLREENRNLSQENRELRAGIFRVKDNLDDDDGNRVLLSEVLSIAGTGMSSPYITLETRDTDEGNHSLFDSDFD